MRNGPPPVSETSAGERLGQLAEELSLLVRRYVELAAAERRPQLRRLGVELAAGLAVVLALLLSFVALSWAAVQGLASALPSWCASLVIAAVWGVVAVVLLRLDHPRQLIRRFSGDMSGDGLARAARERDAAEKAVRTMAEKLGEAVAREASERELRAPIDRAERLLAASEDDVDDRLKNIAVLLLAPGKAGLSLLDVIIGRRSKRADNRGTT